MTAITCHVADVNLSGASDGLGSQLSLRGKQLSDYFRSAAVGTSLSLTLDWSRRNQLPSLVGTGGLNDQDLLNGLATLLGPTKSSDIGLLIGDVYADATDQYGMMFDLDTHGSFGPRQGCALFLAPITLAIQDAGLGQSALSDFIAFTAIHEIGHAFNLWHMAGSGSFMEPHPDPANLGACTFDPTQRNYFALLSDPHERDFVIPGGSPFNARPSGWPVDGSQPFEGPPKAPDGISLGIALSHESFWSFEPVELEVELEVSGEEPAINSFPNEIDPGYSSFQIWITAPDGERRRFRPQRRFCRPNRPRQITRGEPFRRDISVFCKSGGYTFVAPGRHQVQVSFNPRPSQTILSNVVECEVLPSAPDSDEWRRLTTVLHTEGARQLLRFKRRVPSPHDYAALVSVAESISSEQTAAAINLSLGKAMLRTVERLSRPQSVYQLRERGIRHVERALQSKGLSGFRRHVGETLLANG